MRAYLKVNNPEVGRAIALQMRKNGWGGGNDAGFYFCIWLDRLGYVKDTSINWLKEQGYKELTLAEFLEQRPSVERVGSYGIEVSKDKVDVVDSELVATITYEQVKEIVNRLKS